MGFLKKLFNRTIVSTTRKKTVLKEYKVFLDDFPFDCVIAGGTLRDYFLNGKINKKVDVDIFFLSEEERNKAKEWLDNVINGDSIARLALNDNEYYYMPNSDITVNFVFYKTFSTVYNVINSFDFSVCSIAIYKDKVYFNDRFFKDLYDKNIYVNNLEKKVSALYRLSKYKEK